MEEQNSNHMLKMRKELSNSNNKEEVKGVQKDQNDRRDNAMERKPKTTRKRGKQQKTHRMRKGKAR